MEKSHFPMNDVLADTDAYNMNKKLGAASIDSVFNTYYTSSNRTRYKDFTQNFSKEYIRTEAEYFTLGWYIRPLVKWPLLKEVNVSAYHSNAVRDAYTDFIWDKVQNEQ